MGRHDFRGSNEKPDELATWLSDGYAVAYRTAYGLLHNRADAEDAVQEAFLRAWRFRAAVPSGPGIQPWLYRVVVNACLSKMRGENRYRATVVTTTGAGGPEPGKTETWRSREQDGPEGQVLERAEHDLVLKALAALAEPLRVVAVLRYYGGLSENEIASVIHRRPGTVKSRMHEARLRLTNDPRLAALGNHGTNARSGLNAAGAGSPNPTGRRTMP